MALRMVIWLVHVSIPALGLWLLVENPHLDAHYEHHGVHFWLVLATASVAMALGIVLLRAARMRSDARLILVSLVFQFNAGFLALHALATPGIILQTPNAGFVAATPVGLVLGGIAALASAVDYGPAAAERIHRFDWAIAALPIVALGVWALMSLAQLPPLDVAPDPTEAHGPLVAAAFVGSALYLTAGARYMRNYLRTRGTILLSVLTAFVLLSEALFAVGFGRSWRASWWEWHLLLVAAFALIAISAHLQFRREGSALGLFDSITLRHTVAALERDYAHALDAMVDALDARAEGGVSADEPLGAVGVDLARRFGLTERQVSVLAQSARAVGNEREQVRKLGALAAIGERSSVIADETSLLTDLQRLAAEAFTDARIGILVDGQLQFADGSGPDPSANSVPLTVKGRPAGILETGTQPDDALVRSFASQISIAVENARLYQQLDGLFRSYMSPAVATALLADPAQAGLGGEITEVSVLFADLRGFTPFSERSTPDAVVTMLNTYYGAIVPVILAEGGTVVQFVGDAVMAIFNAPTRQPDHALRAARAGLALHEAIESVATSPDWPRFRVGVNTGPALVGNIGAAQMRNFTAIGDTTNLAARLEGLAEPGTVVIGPLTRRQLGDRATVHSRGEITVKGRSEPVACFVLEALS